MPMPSDLDELAFNFFREFARCEYCLKAVGLREPSRRDPEADWGAFAEEIRGTFESPESPELTGAIRYYLENPPKKQIVQVDGSLGWREATPDHHSQAELVLRLVCRTRNNLFHGGKFNGHWFAPQRSHELLRHALVILKHCISSHSQVLNAYENMAI